MNDDGITRRLTAWGEGQPSVRAMLLTSTRAIPEAALDRFSDYDIILVVADIALFAHSRAWLEDFGTVLVAWQAPTESDHGAQQFAYITQYEDGLKIDFSLWEVELLQRIVSDPELPLELDVGYRVLLDKDRLAHGLKPPSYRAYIPAPPSQAAYLELVEVFFHEATYAAKHLWRADLLPAKHNLDTMMKAKKLRKMLEWRVEIDHDWSLKPGDYGKGLKKYLPAETWARLEKTYTGAGIEENWEALFETIELFRGVAREVGERLGYAYPEGLHQRVVAYLEQVRDLD